MGKLFKPAKWEKVGEAINFQTIQGPTQNNEKLSKRKKKKEAKAQKQENENTTKKFAGKGPLAPQPVSPSINKIKSGRIEKKKGKKLEQRKVNLAKIKAAAAAFEGLEEATTTNCATTSAPISSFEARLKEQLMGGRFRYLNEQLYTIDSKKAMTLFREDRDAFDAYHAGYRHQVEKWPTNPLNRIIKAVRRLPKSLEVGDFGCGEGKLAKSVPNKVYSMDLVSCREDIIACDMAKTPLPAQSLDVAVYCLSLMGTNLKDYLMEANRVMKIGGIMFVAEIQSRFDDIYQFVRCLEACGFELVKKDVSVKVFYFFEFKKVRNVGIIAIIPPCQLKPCLYRKR